MPQPYNYNIDLPDPTQVFMQNFQLGQQLKQQAQARALQAKRQEVWAGLGPNATYQDFVKARQQLPDDAEALMSAWKSQNEGRRNAMFDAGSGAFAALTPAEDGVIDAGRAVVKLQEYAAGFENSGDKDAAQQLRDAAKAIELDPTAGRKVLGVMLASADPERFKAIGERTSAIQNFEYFKGIVGEKVALDIVGATPKDGIQVLPNGMIIAGPESPLARSLGGLGGGAQPPSVTNADEYAKIQPGGVYIGPDGQRRVKPQGDTKQGGPAQAAPDGF